MNSQLRLFSSEEVEAIYDKCLEFLQNKAVQVTHPQGLQLLDRAGARVNFDKKHVTFPLDIIESALRSVPRNLILAGRDKKYDAVLPHPAGLFYVRANTGARSYLDPATNACRDMTLADVKEWGQLTEALSNIDIGCFLTPRDVPVQTADIHSFKAILENTTKPVVVQPHSLQSLEYLFELAQTVAGTVEALSQRPQIAILSSPTTPFVFKDMDIEAIIQAARSGVPVAAAALPSAGATSPITIAGTVLLASIEVLTVLVMSQLIKPGLPVIGTINFYALDMLNGRSLTASIESILGSAAATQFMKDAFHIPTHTLGFGTDSFVPDGQFMVETSLKAAIISQAGADILGAAGRLNALAANSPVQLIVDDAVAGMLKRAKSGVTVNNDTLAWEEILNTTPGDHFLKRTHTLRHCREALRSDLFASRTWEAWNSEGAQDLYTRALNKYRELKQHLPQPELPKEAIAEMERIVKRADERLVK